MQGHVVVGTESDNPFAIDIGRFCGQDEDIADLISLKSFANSEFCPRFIPRSRTRPGHGLEEERVAIVTTASSYFSRGELALRTLLVARAARDNGASSVVLVEPDLFFSAQDRGPREEHGQVEFVRTVEDLKKFEGQPFSSQLYAQLLGMAGVDAVVTVHNHSISVGAEFRRCLSGGYFNLSPAEVFAHYALESDVLDTDGDGENLVVCAPDRGAVPFGREICDLLGLPGVSLLELEKSRKGERSVTSRIAETSEVDIGAIRDRDVLIVDDMVRTGGTILECCHLLREGNPRRVVFAVTHFNSSEECRESLSHRVLDEIITTNTIPTILNRDHQGRLRRKIVVLKLEKWIARFLLELAGLTPNFTDDRLYAVDMSSKNPRWGR